jgi:hypothetical protein
LFKDGRLDDDKLIMVIRIVFFPDGWCVSKNLLLCAS